VVLAEADRENWILCQITSNPYGDVRAIEFTDASFATGSLRTTSYASSESSANAQRLFCYLLTPAIARLLLPGQQEI
jgi:hypothetical protein